jgi:hypothetical protein
MLSVISLILLFTFFIFGLQSFTSKSPSLITIKIANKKGRKNID